MWYIILGFVMIVFAWMQAAYGKLQKHKVDARGQWVRIDALLQTRSQYILRILELCEEAGLAAGDLLADIYDLGGGYCKSRDREDISVSAEKVTPLIDRLLSLAKEHAPLENNEEFGELKSNLAELEEEIDFQSDRYNHFIDLYNEHREKPSLRLQVTILGAIPLKGIHLRPENLSLS